MFKIADVFLVIGGYHNRTLSADVHTLDLSGSETACDKKLPDFPSTTYGMVGLTMQEGKPMACGGQTVRGGG